MKKFKKEISKDHVADVLTKGLHSPVFLKHCRHLGLGIPEDLQQSQFGNSQLRVLGRWGIITIVTFVMFVFVDLVVRIELVESLYCNCVVC